MQSGKTKNMINTENDLNRIIAHNKALEQIPFIFSKSDSEGFIYCIENKLFDGYSQPIYKIGGTINIENMLKDHDVNYFENTLLIRNIKVPKKSFFEYMMILRLHNFRISPNRNFFINLKEINKAFDEMEKLINKKNLDDIHNYYLSFMHNFDSKNYCNVKLEINKIANYLPEILLSKKKSQKINLDIEKSGYIYWIEHPYIKDFFNNKIQILIPSLSEEVPWIRSNFLEDIKIIKIFKIEHFGLGKYMFFELSYLSNIKGFYYQISKEEITKILNLIDKYFKTYPDKFQLNFAFGKRVL
jgi:hypothetical protein